MGKFLALESDGNGKIYYFKDVVRKKILNGELNYDLDGHTSIADYHGFKGKMEDTLNRMEYNPITNKIFIDKINTKNDSELVLAECKRLNMRNVVPELIVHSVASPFEIDRKVVTEEEIGLLHSWIPLALTARNDVWNGIRMMVGKTVGMTVGSTISDTIGASIRNGIWDKIWDNCGSSFYAYYASYFEGLNYKYKDGIKLWENGLVAGSDTSGWFLRGGKSGEILYRKT